MTVCYIAIVTPIHKTSHKSCLIILVGNCAVVERAGCTAIFDLRMELGWRLKRRKVQGYRLKIGPQVW